MFKEKQELITIVNNEQINFIIINNQKKEGTLIKTIGLDKFLSAEPIDLDIFHQKDKEQFHSLLIIPDYWVGNDSFTFQSKKPSIVIPFIERKLIADHSEFPEIVYFFSYHFYQNEQKEQKLYCYYFQDAKCFQIYNKFSKYNLPPHRITIPAYLLDQKIKKEIPEFSKGGKIIVKLMPFDCFIYFFFHGNFIFSRNIKLPELYDSVQEKFNNLTFEINQSLYLFSQKTKIEVDQFFILSINKDDIKELGVSIGKEIKNLGPLFDSNLLPYENIKEIGASYFFGKNDLSRSNNVFSISHKILKAETEWKPIQLTGIIIGLLLIVILLGETFLIFQYSNKFQLPSNIIRADREQRQHIQKVNQSLDSILLETQKPNPVELSANILKSLSENIILSELKIETDMNPGIEFKGIVKAKDPDNFKEIISSFVHALNKNIKLNQPVNIKDVNFETIEQNYIIRLKFSLM
ncbi:MAG: hypothetical protein HQK79_15420 [Desulfobacterales bacterium]|nr:hypothetical protein [Desulfobacterales bacterium]MBF0395431.1 hypothetical protein [Desulfobacterales bacterium]